MKLKAKINKDLIVYSKGKQIDTDKERLAQNVALSEFYSNKYSPEEIKSDIINPTNIINNLNDKLSKEEIFILNNYLKVK